MNSQEATPAFSGEAPGAKKLREAARQNLDTVDSLIAEAKQKPDLKKADIDAVIERLTNDVAEYLGQAETLDAQRAQLQTQAGRIAEKAFVTDTHGTVLRQVEIAEDAQPDGKAGTTAGRVVD